MATAVKKVSNTTTIRFDDDYTRQVIDMAAELLNQTRNRLPAVGGP
jgi:predicted transcriptional regulator